VSVGADPRFPSGYSCRAVWVASVKWLRRIVAIDRPSAATIKRTIHGPSAAPPTVQRRSPFQEMAVKSEIVRPRDGETLAWARTRLFGVAWAVRMRLLG